MNLDLAMHFRSKAQATTTKNRLNFIRIKIFCASQHTIKNVNRQPTERKKIFANHRSDKELVSRIHIHIQTTLTI